MASISSKFTIEDLVVKRLWVEDKRIDSFNLGTLVTIDESYNIGVGTDAPEMRLDIVGDTGIRIPIGQDASRPSVSDMNGILRFNNHSDKMYYESYISGEWRPIGGSNLELCTISSSSKPTILINKKGLTTSSDGGSIEFNLESNGGLKSKQAKIVARNFSSAGNASLALQTAENSNYFDRIFIKHDGNVGIGNTSPTKKLHVSGDAQVNTLFTNGGVKNINSTGTYLNFGTNEIYLGVNDSSVLFVSSNNNVGIGTQPSSSYKLHVNGSIAGQNIYSSLVDSANINVTSSFEAVTANVTNKLGIKQNDPKVVLDINDTGAIQLPKGTTTQRDSLSTIRQGMIRYNTTTEQFEGYGAGNAWGSLGGVKDIDQDTFITVSNGTTDTDEIKFFAGNTSTEKMIIQSNGRVGIGTSSPGAKLEIDSGVTGSSSTSIIHIEHDGRKMMDLGSESTSYHSGKISIYQSTLSNPNSEVLRLSGNGVTYFNGGRLGIGTTDPKELLHVRKDINNGKFYGLYLSNMGTRSSGQETSVGIRFNTYSLGDNATTGEIMSKQDDDGYSMDFYTSWDSASQKIMTLKKGNVGIGYDSPQDAIHTTGNIRIGGFGVIRAAQNAYNHQGTISLQAAGSGNSSSDIHPFKASAGSELKFGKNTNNSYFFSYKQYGTTVLYVNSNYQFGIGTTSLSAKLQITQAQQTTSNTTPFLRLMPSSLTDNTGLTSMFFSTSTADNYGISLNGWRKEANGKPYFAIKTHNNSASGTTRFFIDPHGNVAVATESPDQKFHVELGSQERVLFKTTAAEGGGGGLMIGDTYNHATIPMYYITNDGGICYTGTRNNCDLDIRTNWASRIKITKDGKIGINGVTPYGHLTVKSQNRSISILDSGTENYSEIRAHAQTNQNAYAYMRISGYALDLKCNGGTTVLNINNDKNAYIYHRLGIGSPTMHTVGGDHPLVVNDSIAISHDSNHFAYLRCTTAGELNFQYYDDGANSGTIQIQPYGGIVELGNYNNGSDRTELKGGCSIRQNSNWSKSHLSYSTNGDWYIRTGNSSGIVRLCDDNGYVKIGDSGTSSDFVCWGWVGCGFHTDAGAGTAHHGNKTLFISSRNKTDTKWGWWIGAQKDTPSTGDNDLYFARCRGSTSAGDAGYIQDDANAVRMNFTGQHRTFVKNIPHTKIDPYIGLIVCANNNDYVCMTNTENKKAVSKVYRGKKAIEISESLPVVSLCIKEKDKSCFGVISNVEDEETRTDGGNFTSVYRKELGDTRTFINSLGEGAIWITNKNGHLESGDYITTSKIPGYGQKQNEEYLANYTVAKITMDCNFNPGLQKIFKIKKHEKDIVYYRSEIEIPPDEEIEELPDKPNMNKKEIFASQHHNYTLDISKNVLFVELSERIYEYDKDIAMYKNCEFKKIIKKEIINVLNENNEFIWEETDEYEREYEIRYVEEDGSIIEKEEYESKKANGEKVYIAAFVGCTYHCG